MSDEKASTWQTINKKMLPTEWEKIFTNHIYDR